VNTQIAIVIPAYKSAFLAETLRSLAEQTVKDFHIYIGDDASPNDIATVVDTFVAQLAITYKRFDKNIGGKDLTSHWKRCIEMIQGEPWIWLLPDDDVATPECISTFLQAVSADCGNNKLYRFQTSHINGKGEILFDTITCPALESNIDLLLNKLQFTRSSSVAEYIFSKAKYDEVGGFTSLPLAWGSDDWLWIQLSQQEDILTLPAGRVLLRQSELNISSNLKDYTQQKFTAKYEFFDLVLGNVKLVDKIEHQNKFGVLKQVIEKHLFYEYRSYDLHFINKTFLFYARRNNKLLGGGILRNMYRLIRYEISML
jgi:glycosyltransferase involved in cell wall biosynthesis